MLKKIYKLGQQTLWLKQRELLREKHELNYLFWECTMNCNFKCKHCGSSAGYDFFPDTLSTKEIKGAFLDVSKNFDAKKIMVAVTGGEPLLRKDLFEVMKYAHSLGFNWGMVTNGSLINQEVIEKACDAGMITVDVSIDGIGEKHDIFRGVFGAYEKAINACKLFQKANFLNSLRITTSVCQDNISQIEDMYNIFSSLGIKKWRLSSVDPIGRAANNKNFLLNKKQLVWLLNFIKQKRKKKGEMQLTYGCAGFLGNEYENEVRDGFFYCRAGVNIGTILYNGDIFVCPNVPRQKELIQGNIKIDSFSDTWNNKLAIFRDKNRTSCAECKKCANWDECRGGSFHSWNFEKKCQNVCFMRDNIYLGK